MDLILQQAIPYKSLTFIYQYLHLHKKLNKSERKQYFRSIFAIILFKSAYHIFLAAFPPTTTANKLLLADIVQLANLPPVNNLIVVANSLLSGYFIVLNYIDENSYVAYVVTRIDELFVREKTRALISSRLYNKRDDEGGVVTVYAYIQRYCSRVLLLLQFFIIGVDLVIVVSQVVGIWLLLGGGGLPCTTFWQKVVIFIFGELNVCTFYLLLFTFCYAHILQGALAFTLLEAVRLLLGQLQALLLNFTRKKRTTSKKEGKKCRKKLRSSLLVYQQAVFRYEYTRAVVTITRGNHYLGVAFVPLLLVNCPANALLTIFLLNYELVIGAQLILMMLLLQQFICLFIVHSFVAQLNARLSRLAKMFIPLVYADRSLAFNNLISSKQRLFNCLFVERFHTAKPYGFTYYKFGLISMFNFFKYVMLYTELLLIIYKNFKLCNVIL